MSYQLSFSPQAGYLSVDISGQPSLHAERRAALAAWAAIARTMRATGSGRLLLRWRSEVPMPTVVTFDFAERWARKHWSFEWRTAVSYDSPGLGQDFQFLENVAVNRGLQFKVFTDPATALAWLQGV